MSTTTLTQQRVRRSGMGPFLITAALVLVIGGIWGATARIPPGESVAYLIGYGFFPALLLIGGALFIFFTMTRNAIVAGQGAFSIGLIILAPAAWYGAAALIAGPVSTGAHMRQIATEMRAYYATLIADQTGFERRVAALHLEQILEPSSLAADPSFARRRARVQEARGIVDEQRALMIRRQTEMSARLAAISEAEAADFNSGAAIGRAKVERLHSLNRQVLDEISALIDLLERTRGQWLVRGQSILFRNQQTMNAYNRRIETLQGLVRQTTALQAEMRRDQGDVDAAITDAEQGRWSSAAERINAVRARQ